MFNDKTTSYRNYTCVVKSLHATVYFLKLEDFHHFYRYIPVDQVTQGVKQRLELLKHQMKTIRNVCKADYDRVVNQIENVETLLKENQTKIQEGRVDGSPNGSIKQMIENASLTQKNMSRRLMHTQSRALNPPDFKSARKSTEKDVH